MPEATKHTRTTRARNTPISLRVPNPHLDLIDRAANALGKNRTEFMLDTAFREAQAVLSDQTILYLDDEAWNAFISALDTSPEDNPKLRALVNRKPLWES